MILQEYLKKLCKELEIDPPQIDENKLFPLKFGKDLINIKDLNPGVALHAQIRAVPTKKKEELFLYLMRANLLGQGTGGCRIGMDEKEKFLTLSLGLPYEMSYQAFQEAIEDFVNYLVYWREEVIQFEQEKSIYG